MTKFGKTLAVISLLCAGISSAASAQAANQQVSATCSMESEKAKWVALRMVLNEKIAHSKSFMNKVGAAMNRYAPLWAGIVGVTGMVGMKWYRNRSDCRSSSRPVIRYFCPETSPESEQSGQGGSSSAREDVQLMDSDEDDAALDDDVQPSQSASQYSSSFARVEPLQSLPGQDRGASWFNKCIKKPAKKLIPDCYGMSFLLPATLVYALCKTCGAYLEASSTCCFAVVTEIAGKWDDFKTYMPTALHPFFLGYAQDLKTHGKLTTIDKNGARQLIESILAMSVVIEAAK
ncbi:MAG: hypothetical protein WCW33_00670 [Candidatus Babeliales bacterium]|jgi:hypothetical protein